MILPAVTEYDYVVQVNGTEMRGKLLIGAGDIDHDSLCRPSQTMTKDQDHVVADVYQFSAVHFVNRRVSK